MNEPGNDHSPERFSRHGPRRRAFGAAGAAFALLLIGVALVLADDLDKPFAYAQYLVHATGHGTTSGGVADDRYMLLNSEPDANGHFVLPDGSGGTFGYSSDFHAGPFLTPRAVCDAAAARGLPDQTWTVGYDYNTSFNCAVAAPSAAETTPSGQPTPGCEKVKAGVGGANPGDSSCGAFEVGIGCATEGVMLHCMASVSEPPNNADLVYEWRIDGYAQVAPGARMDVDLEAAAIAEGDHLVTVTVTDRTSGLVGSRSQTMQTTARIFAVRTPICTTSQDSSGAYELSCSTSAMNEPANADLVFDWIVDGRPYQGTDSIQRTVGQGAVLVSVSARDRTSGRQTAITAMTVLINPVGLLTNLLTGGQTSDPANVVTELVGSGLGAAALAAWTALSGSFGGPGSPPGGGTPGTPGGGSAPGGGVPQSGNPAGDRLRAKGRYAWSSAT